MAGVWPTWSDFDSFQTSYSTDSLGFMYEDRILGTRAEIYVDSYFNQDKMLRVTFLGVFRPELETSASFGNKMAKKDPSSSVATQSKWAIVELSFH